jgi:hypothetical protein
MHIAQHPASRSKSGAWTPDRSHQGRYEYETAAVTDTIVRHIRWFMIAGQVSEHTGARALVSSLPAADWRLGYRRYDADWFREDLVNTGITLCNPGRKSQESSVEYDSHRSRCNRFIPIMSPEPDQLKIQSIWAVLWMADLQLRKQKIVAAQFSKC